VHFALQRGAELCRVALLESLPCLHLMPNPARWASLHSALSSYGSKPGADFGFL
jgi:hypothetical protein